MRQGYVFIIALGVRPIVLGSPIYLLSGFLGSQLREAVGYVFVKPDASSAYISQVPSSRLNSSSSCAGVHIRCPSEMVNCRTRISPCISPESSLRNRRGGLAVAHGKVAVASCIPVYEYLDTGTDRSWAAGRKLRLPSSGSPKMNIPSLIMIPVAGDLVEIALGHQGASWSAGSRVFCSSSSTKRCSSWMTRGALGQHNGQSLADHVHGGEIFQLPAKLVVIPLLGLFQLSHVSCSSCASLLSKAVP